MLTGSWSPGDSPQPLPALGETGSGGLKSSEAPSSDSTDLGEPTAISDGDAGTIMEVGECCAKGLESAAGDGEVIPAGSRKAARGDAFTERF